MKRFCTFLVGSVLLLWSQAAMAITVDEVIQLSKAGVSAQKLIGVIEAERTVFKLDAALVAKLAKAGVSDQVIVFMQKTPQRYAVSVEPLPETLPKTKLVKTPKQRAGRRVVLRSGAPEQRVEKDSLAPSKPAKKTLLSPKPSNAPVQRGVRMGLGFSPKKKRKTTKTGYRKSYKSQMLVTDLLGLFLTPVTAGLSYVFSGSVAHSRNGNGGAAVWSPVLRIGMPLAGFVVVGAFGKGERFFQLAGVGALVGLVGGLVIDYSMAYKTITPKKQAAFQFGTLSATPQLSITREGDFTLGLNGRF